MKNKFLILGLMMVLVLSLASCTSDKNEEATTDNTTTESTTEGQDTVEKESTDLAFEVRELGISLAVPGYWEEHIENIMPLVTTPEYIEAEDKNFGSIDMAFIPVSTLELIANQEELTDPEEIQAFNEKVMGTVRTIVSIMVYDKDVANLEDDAETLATLTGYEVNEALGQHGDLVYFLSYDNLDVSELDDASKVIFEEAFKGIETLRETTQLTDLGVSPQKAASEGRIADFKTKDIKGNDVDNSIFANSKLTMINFWGTYCGPCIEEMEDLEELSHELKAVDAQLIGIVVDGTTDEGVELANVITDQKGVTFTSIIPENAINVSIMQSITAVPTSIFVDSQGNVVGDPIIGVRSKQDYYDAAKALLDEM